MINIPDVHAFAIGSFSLRQSIKPRDESTGSVQSPGCDTVSMSEQHASFRFLDLPTEIQSRILAELLNEWNASSIRTQSVREYSDDGSFSYSQPKFAARLLYRRIDAYHLRQVCRHFSDLCDAFEWTGTTKIKHLKDFGGTYRPHQRACLRKCSSEARHSRSWREIDLGGVPPGMQPLRAILSLVRTLQLPESFVTVTTMTDLRCQFPLLENVVFFISTLGSLYALSCDDSDERLLDKLSSDETVNPLWANGAAWFYPLCGQDLRVFIQYLIGHVHRQTDETIYSSLVSSSHTLRDLRLFYQKLSYDNYTCCHISPC